MTKRERFRTWFMEHITLHEHEDDKTELANGLTHLFGAGLSLVALAAIIIKTVPQDDPTMAFAGIIFGLTMLLLYFSSSMYHLVSGPLVKRIMRIMDHSTIYMLIAGTYTPVMLYVGNRPATIVLIAVWSLTVIGIAFTLLFWGRYGALHVVFYIAMGWMIVFIWDSLQGIPTEFLYWAIAGGVTYTAGTLVYAAKQIPYYHAIWHLFVVGGSASFFIGIYQHLL
ncbi:PAQR family membrane homeostasis protein TrhA [Spirochaeta africana]|nr:hemolysin III family protein [Spirochaeta africana]